MDKSPGEGHTIRRVLLAILFAALTLDAAGANAGEAFRSDAFLAWKSPNQDAYIETSVGMASLIAAQRDGAQADCIDDWYYGDEAAANAAIRDVMAANPAFHPRGVILAVLQKRCGKIGGS